MNWPVVHEAQKQTALTSASIFVVFQHIGIQNGLANLLDAYLFVSGLKIGMTAQDKVIRTSSSLDPFDLRAWPPARFWLMYASHLYLTSVYSSPQVASIGKLSIMGPNQ